MSEEGIDFESNGLFSSAQKSGTRLYLPTGWQNELHVSELLPHYSRLNELSTIFSINFPAAALAAPSATALGAFALFNPPTSGKNLHLIDIQIGVTTWTLVTTTVVAIGAILIPNQMPTSTSQTGIVVRSNFVGGPATSVAQGYVSGTVAGAPVLANRIIAGFLLATAVGGGDMWAKDEVAGAIVIPPNNGIQIQGLSGTEANVTAIVGLTWAELPA